MQTAIVIFIVVISSFFLIQRFYNSVKKGQQSTCSGGCSGCNPDQKEDCSEIKIQNPKA